MLRPGQSAQVNDESSGLSASATVVSVGKEVGEGGVEVRLNFDDPGAAPGGRDLRVAIDAGLGESTVLSVPITAIYTTMDGSTFVSVVGDNETVVDVEVVTGLHADGWVAIEPASAEGSVSLTPGTRVVVGIENAR